MTAVFDPLDAGQLADPLPVYRALRDHDPAQRIDLGGGTRSFQHLPLRLTPTPGRAR